MCVCVCSVSPASAEVDPKLDAWHRRVSRCAGSSTHTTPTASDRCLRCCASLSVCFSSRLAWQQRRAQAACACTPSRVVFVSVRALRPAGALLSDAKKLICSIPEWLAPPVLHISCCWPASVGPLPAKSGGPARCPARRRQPHPAQLGHCQARMRLGRSARRANSRAASVGPAVAALVSRMRAPPICPPAPCRLRPSVDASRRPARPSAALRWRSCGG
jgi:hypothetical protein